MSRWALTVVAEAVGQEGADTMHGTEDDWYSSGLDPWRRWWWRSNADTTETAAAAAADTGVAAEPAAQEEAAPDTNEATPEAASRSEAPAATGVVEAVELMSLLRGVAK